MQTHPFDDLPPRDPDTIQDTISVIEQLSPNNFGAIFGEFCETITDIGEKHKSCTHQGPLIIIGIDLTENHADIAAVSEPLEVEGTPVDYRPEKPAKLQQYDTVGVVQANIHLDSAELIQGALIEQLSTQWHVVLRLQDFESHLTNLFQGQLPEDTPFEQLQNPSFEDPFISNNESVDLFPTPSNTSDTPPDDLFEGYQPEDYGHLELSNTDLQCTHCHAVYDFDEVHTAVQCCPTSESDIPLDEKDHNND